MFDVPLNALHLKFYTKKCVIFWDKKILWIAFICFLIRLRVDGK